MAKVKTYWVVRHIEADQYTFHLRKPVVKVTRIKDELFGGFYNEVDISTRRTVACRVDAELAFPALRKLPNLKPVRVRIG